MVGTLTAIGLGLAAASAGTQVKAAHDQGKAAKDAGLAQQAAANSDAARLEYNASYVDQQAEDAIARGGDEESRFRAGVRGLIGQQRAGFSSQNVDVGFGSAADVQADSAFLGNLDAMTIRNNAKREALGFRAQAEDLRRQADVVRRGGAAAAAAGRQAGSAANWQAAGSLLGAGSSLLLARYGWGTRTGSSTTAPTYRGDALPGYGGTA